MKIMINLLKQILEIIFGSFSVITKRTLADHLKNGQLDNACNGLRNELKSCPTTNVYPESNFGVLARLMREMSNANEITIESVIMCKGRVHKYEALFWPNVNISNFSKEMATILPKLQFQY